MEILATFGPLILMVVIFYFLLIRPQQKKQKQVRNMQQELKKGDKIITIGGFHATVHALDEDQIVLLAGDGTKLTYDRSAVREVVEQS
ncbi:preprotein translocase subunit YajC [Gracilibacillus salitolerans]|uniref:Preprotein translocase subunit YajC n=1 Tax=Gracilibacillus salitolerans TaxID=2663022 RepID=A0A5Q2TK29_9BACI|nr:preprotein translocase subunit YajC [Gracilibacillus salitolerans]QGH35086.1 preprotein translocase subunit YajC [Gracilibacillus salitolerans]